MAHSVRLPAPNLVNDVSWTLDGSEAVSHRVTETMHRASCWYVFLHPIVQCGTGCIGVRCVRLVVAWETPAQNEGLSVQAKEPVLKSPCALARGQPNEPIGATGYQQYRQALSKGLVFENSIFGIFYQSKPVKECITVCNFYGGISKASTNQINQLFQ